MSIIAALEVMKEYWYFERPKRVTEPEAEEEEKAPEPEALQANVIVSVRALKCRQQQS